MAEINVDVLLTAKDAATAAIKQFGNQVKATGGEVDKMGKNTQDLNTTLGTMQTLVTGLASGLLVKTMGSWVNAATQAQKEMFQVQNNLKNAAKSTETLTQVIKGNKKQLDDQVEAIKAQISAKKDQIEVLKLSGEGHEAEIEAIQKEVNALRIQELQTQNTTVTKDKFRQVLNKNALQLKELEAVTTEVSNAYMQLGFDDEDVALAFSKDLMITKDVAEAKQVLALSADLARAKGIELADAGNAVTLALMGSSRVLKQFGIDLDENATKSQVMDALLQKVGGSAQSYSETYAAAIDRMKVAWENLNETLGVQFLPTLTNLTTNLTAFIVAIQQYPDLITAITGAFLGLTILLTGKTIVSLLGLIGMASATGLVIMGLALIVGAAVLYIAKHWDVLQANIKEVWFQITNYFDKTVKPAIEKFLQDVGAKIDYWTGWWGSKFNQFKGVVEGVVGALRTMWDLATKAGQFGLGIHFQAGGIVPGAIGQTVPIFAHAGEEVLPVGRASSGGGGGGGGPTFNVSIGLYAGTETEKRNIARDLYSALVQLASAENKSVAELMGR